MAYLINVCFSLKETTYDSRGVPGWEAVDKLAEYLVSLNRTITALSTAEVTDILRLYSSLLPMDKAPCKYTLKSKKRNLPGHQVMYSLYSMTKPD